MKTLTQNPDHYRILWERAIRDGKQSLSEDEHYELLCWIAYDSKEFVRRRMQYLNTGKDGC